MTRFWGAVGYDVPFRQMCLTMDSMSLSIVKHICRRGTIWRKHEKVNRLLSRISPGYRLKQGFMSAPQSKSLRYFVAIAATAVVFTIRFLLGSTLGDVAPLVMFT